MTAPGESLEARLAAVLDELIELRDDHEELLSDFEDGYSAAMGDAAEIVRVGLAVVVAADVEQAAADRAAVLRDAARDLEGRLGTEGAPRTLWEFREWLHARAALEGPPS